MEVGGWVGVDFVADRAVAVSRSWIFFSNLTILFNKWMIDGRGFSKSRLLSPGVLCWRTTTQMLTTHSLLPGYRMLNTYLPTLDAPAARSPH